MQLGIDMWLNLVIRWFHVMAGIAWIGTSFFFIWLDNHLQPQAGAGEGHVGKAWLFHGGGYYQVDKALVAPESILSSLHWFKWEAYLTWLSGFCLLIVVYYWHAGAYMIDPAVAQLSVAAAIAIGLATLVLGWLVYDVLWRVLGPRSPRITMTVSLVLYVGAAYALTHLLSGRAAYIHSGAMLGTIMAANVLFVIQPNQRKMYAANRRGETPDPALSHQSKQRSTHNNYLTLPVIFMMISNHFAMTYGHAFNWLILVVLFFAGMGVDHYLNTRDKAQKRWGYAAVGGAFVAVVAMVFFTALPMRPVPVAAAGGQATATGTVAFARVHHIVQTRCQACHSAHPSSPLFTAAPLGIELDTPRQIKQLAPRIKAMAVDTHTMPLGNQTHMTERERQILGAWIAQGANIPAGDTQ